MIARVLVALGAGGLAVLLTGCGAHAESAPVTPVTVSGAPAASLPEALTVVATPRRSGTDCELMSAQDAAGKWLVQVPPPDGTSLDWELTPEGAAGYDPCADLSWMVVDVPRAEASSPRQVMLFHHGRYVGTASHDPYVGAIAVTRGGGGALTVGYHPAGARTDDRTPAVTATLTWDESAHRVTYVG